MTTTAQGTSQAAAAADAHPLPAKNKAKPYFILGGIVTVVGLGYGIFHVVTAGHENTDDAQVAADMVPISTRVTGMVINVPVTDNQAVKQGDLLAEIDPTDYDNRVKQATAELAAAQAQADGADAQVAITTANSKGGLGVARAALSGSAASVAGADARIQAAKAALAKAQADADKADNDLKRAQSLRKDDAIPQAQLDNMTSSAASAHAQVAQAQAQLAGAQDERTTAATRIAEAQGRVEQSAPVDAQLAAARANAALAHARVATAGTVLDQAKLQLSYTKIVAPADGHIARLGIHQGQVAQNAQVVTNLLPNVTYVLANFKETQVGNMHPGQVADISLDAYPGRTFRAKVDSISYGTGAQFSLLPPDNASGNFVKVVQRVPVRLAWTDIPNDVHPQAGLSADVTVNVR